MVDNSGVSFDIFTLFVGPSVTLYHRPPAFMHKPILHPLGQIHLPQDEAVYTPQALYGSWLARYRGSSTLVTYAFLG